MKSFFFLFIFLIGVVASANNPGVSYQGRIFKPDGNPLEGTSVQFRMQVRSPGSENCLLYEEVQTMNMAASSGIFSITMNDGSGTRLDNPDYQVDRIFANRDTMTLDATRCSVGTTYVPNSGDGRKFIVYFKDETMGAYEPLPIMSLNYAPQAMYALEAQKVDKFAINNILRAVDGSGNPVTAPALDPTQLTNLTNLLAGTSTQYATTTQFNTVQTFAKSAPPTCGAGEVLKSNGTSLSCVTDSAGGAPAYSAITAASATNTIDNTNFAQTWNWSTATTQSPMSMNANALTTGSLMSVATSSASLNSTSGLINVANTGASTSGILARFQSNSTAGSGLTVLTNGNVGVGTTTPTGKLHVEGGSTAYTLFAKGDGQNVAYIEGSGASAYPTLSVSNTSNRDSATFYADANKTSGNMVNISTGNANFAGTALEMDMGVYTSGNFTGKFLDFKNSGGTNGVGGPTKFSVSSTGGVYAAGNVGIGTTAPANKLHVVTSDGTSGLLLEQGSVAQPQWIAVGASNIAAAGAAQLEFGISGGNNQFFTGTTQGDMAVKGYSQANDKKLFIGAGSGSAAAMTILPTGNVGIGTTGPGQKLEVNGGVRLNTATAKPTCDATTRGTFWMAQGGAGVKDTVEVCAKDVADAYAWRTLY